MNQNYFLIHGSFGSPFSNWIPYLRKNIENKGFEVYTPDLPTGVGKQNFKNWSFVMKAYVDANLIHENTTIFAHSIAPVFVCKFLVEHHISVKRLVFICGFNQYFGIDEAYDEVNKTMYFDSFKEIKKYCNDIICYYTDNDPYVPYDVEREFASIATKKFVVPGGGYLNAESGYDEFNELLEWV